MAESAGKKVVTPLLRLMRLRRQPSFGLDQSIEEAVGALGLQNWRQGERGKFDRTERPATEFDGDRRFVPSATDGFGTVITHRPRRSFTFIVAVSIEMRPLGPCLYDHLDEAGAQAC